MSHVTLLGTLTGHSGWVTSIATPLDNSDFIISGSRDKTLIKWSLTRTEGEYGFPYRSLHGHSGFVEDVVLSSDGQFALSGSWDGTLRLWDLEAGKSARRFVGHKKDVLSVAFSSDNRQIVSGSRDHSLKLWNTLGECKYSITEATNGGHQDWVSCVRFTPQSSAQQLIVSASWDKTVKVWDLHTFNLLNTLVGHTGYVNTVTISPDGSLCASGGKDGNALLWELSKGERLSSFDGGNIIHALCFSPNRYWLCAATESSIRIWDLEAKSIIEEIKAEPIEGTKTKSPYCLSLAWSADGNTLYAGYTDGVIRVYGVRA